ncbi:ATP-binding protein [Mycobacterium sp. NPDC003449]
MIKRPQKGLLGRQHEQEVLAQLLDRARDGHSGVLVIRGGAGIGKTALLEYAMARASGLRSLHVSGSESEMELAYAGLHQLCGPLLDRLDRLPPPQNRALSVALGLVDGEPPDRLIVGLAVLTLLGDASGERPTICVVDDAQWVDTASLQALAFVSRRLLADPVVMIFAAREPGLDNILDDQPQLVLGGLDISDARTLLTSILPGRLNEQVRENILAEAAGNPLALLELHRVVTPAELAGGFGLAGAGQLVNRLEQGFRDRLGRLPDPTRTLLLIGAADPTGEPSWLASAAKNLGVPTDAIEAAEAADLVSVGSRVRFRHPLVRSAVYRSSPLSERRRVHRALADVVDGPNGGAHRAWHLANAAPAPDEGIAEQLERSAEHAHARSGVAAAAAFLEFAVELTPDPERRARRTLAAAQAKLDAGAPEAASKLLIGARHATSDTLLSARIDLLRARSACPSGRGGDMTSLLLQTAGRLRDIDTELSRDTYCEALVAAILAGRLAGAADTTAVAVARAARDAAPPVEAPRMVDLLLDALIARIVDGYVSAAPLLRRVVRKFLSEDAADSVDKRWYDAAVQVAMDLFDHDAFERIANRQLELLRGAGVLAQLPVGLGSRATIDVYRGRFVEAAAYLAEAEAVATAIGGHVLRRSDPLLAAYRGQEQYCKDMVRATTESEAIEHGQGFSIAIGVYALAVLHNGLGHYAEAFTACETALQHDDPGVAGHVLVEMVESATRCGDLRAAGAALGRLVERAQAAGTDTGLGLAARSRALVGDGPAAEDEYLSAITHLERSPAVVYLARTHLVYGEWLRRQGRRVEARTRLRTAHGMFTGMGADGFAERSRRELEATGESVRRRNTDAAGALTTQESLIVRLAGQGHTNSEIAAQLFISPRTVEWHMGRIFTKLGISSRRDLRTAAVPAG